MPHKRNEIVSWIMAHLDGHPYSVHDIGYYTGTNPVNVRNAIHYLGDAGIIKVEQNGVGRYSRWRFYPKR
jgi:hypothetical protein